MKTIYQFNFNCTRPTKITVKALHSYELINNVPSPEALKGTQSKSWVGLF